jgi:hypothetical protein
MSAAASCFNAPHAQGVGLAFAALGYGGQRRWRGRLKEPNMVIDVRAIA